MYVHNVWLWQGKAERALVIVMIIIVQTEIITCILYVCTQSISSKPDFVQCCMIMVQQFPYYGHLDVYF